MPQDGKTIWLINQYASTPDTGMGGRHYYLARELARQGHRVYLVAAGFTHLLQRPKKLNKAFEIQPVAGFSFVWIRTPEYPQAHSRKRIFNWLLFAWKLRQLPRVIPDAPDAILYSSPSPVGYLGAQWLSRHYNASLTFDVRDIWPMSLIHIGGYSSRHLFIRFLQWLEDKAYRESDRVVSNLRNAVAHMESRGMDPLKFAWIPNGFSMDEVSNAQPLPSETLALLPRDKFIVGYAGTLGFANKLDTLIEAADLLKVESDIAFVVVGGGREESALQELARKKNLRNVLFIKTIPKAQVQSMLAMFDACYIGLAKDPLFKFGVSPNKLFDYLYAGKPILYAIDSGDYEPVGEIRAGIQVEPGNPRALADAVLQLRGLSRKERADMGLRGRNAAVEQYEYGMLAMKLAEVLFSKRASTKDARRRP